MSDISNSPSNDQEMTLEPDSRSPSLTWSHLAQPHSSQEPVEITFPTPSVAELDTVAEEEEEDQDIGSGSGAEDASKDGSFGLSQISIHESGNDEQSISMADVSNREQQAGGRNRDKEEMSDEDVLTTVDLNSSVVGGIGDAKDPDPAESEEFKSSDEIADIENFRFKSKYLYGVHSGIKAQFIDKWIEDNPGRLLDGQTVEEICAIVDNNYGTADLFGPRYLNHIKDHGPVPEFMFAFRQMHEKSKLFELFGKQDIHYHSLAKLKNIFHTTSTSIVNVDDAIKGHILKYDRQV